MQLKQACNASLGTSEMGHAQDIQTQALYKAVKGLLNKLTPQKFDKLSGQIKALSIDTEERLRGVIDLIFAKACDEPEFCQTYAKLCQDLQDVQLKEATQSSKEVKNKGSFRYNLITKCQNQFQSESTQSVDLLRRQEEADSCTDREKKNELIAQLEEDVRKFRRMSVGNCRFIGELYKIQMLSASIMCHCINELLEKVYDESLECLCNLLTVSGKELETSLGNTTHLDNCFKKMKIVSEKSDSKLSHRIRFMLQNTIELRYNGWVPRNEAKPETVELNEELPKNESRMISQMHFQKDDQGRLNDGTGRQNFEEQMLQLLQDMQMTQKQMLQMQQKVLRCVYITISYFTILLLLVLFFEW